MGKNRTRRYTCSNDDNTKEVEMNWPCLEEGETEHNQKSHELESPRGKWADQKLLLIHTVTKDSWTPLERHWVRPNWLQRAESSRGPTFLRWGLYTSGGVKRIKYIHCAAPKTLHVIHDTYLQETAVCY